MAANTPSWAKGLPNYTLYDKYDVARSYLVDTAETPAQKKKLKDDLQKLRKEYLTLKAAQTATGPAAIKAIQQRTSDAGVAAAEHKHVLLLLRSTQDLLSLRARKHQTYHVQETRTLQNEKQSTKGYGRV